MSYEYDIKSNFTWALTRVHDTTDCGMTCNQQQAKQFLGFNPIVFMFVCIFFKTELYLSELVSESSQSLKKRSKFVIFA